MRKEGIFANMTMNFITFSITMTISISILN